MGRFFFFGLESGFVWGWSLRVVCVKIELGLVGFIVCLFVL